jgi:FOG: Ankyrin repeat
MDGHDLFKEVMEPATCKTAPLSPTTCTLEQDYDLDSDQDGEVDGDDNSEEDEDEGSITQLLDDEEDDDDFLQDYYRFNYRNQVFFPEKEGGYPSNRSYALQITPSGQVKQISPNGKSCRSTLESESPFVYASLFHTSSNIGKMSQEEGRVEDGPMLLLQQQQQNAHPASILQSILADDFLPIHIACLYRASPEVIQLLIQCYPEGVEHKNNWGMLPLHIVCSNYSLEPPNIMASKLDNDFTTKAYLNKLYKESMEKEESPWDMEKVVEMLVKAFPQSVNIPSDNVEWFTPLEYVTRNIQMGQGREEIMGILRKAHEQQYQLISRGTTASASIGAGRSCDESSLSDSRASNGNGIKAFYIADCPLLYTYISGKQWDRTIERLEKAPEEASYWVVDKDYPRLPIHLACSNAAPKEVVESLLDAYPEACLAKDGSGSHPLHLACEKALGIEVVSLLLKKSRKAARVKDEIGRLPLHLACASGANSEVVKALVDAYPQSCYMKDYNGHTAFTYADYCIQDDAVKNEISSTFQVCEEQLFGGKGRRSRNSFAQEERLLEDEEFDA